MVVAIATEIAPMIIGSFLEMVMALRNLMLASLAHCLSGVMRAAA
jgi:hypothetical protein